MEPSSNRAGASVNAHAEAVVLAACILADTAGQWSPEAIEDAASALEVLAGALAQLDFESAEILAVVPAAVAALRERTETRANAPADESSAVPGGSTVSGALRRALAAHGIHRGRVHQLGPALVTLTLEAADAQALAALLTPRGEQGGQDHRAVDNARGMWGAGPAGTAAAALALALTAYGASSYARVLDSGKVTAGITPHAAQQLAMALTTKPAPAALSQRRGLGHGWRGLSQD